MKNKPNVGADIGTTLRKYRIDKGLSQRLLAHCLEISRQAYIGWENNSVDFRTSQLQKIAEFYNIPMHKIIEDSYT